MNENFNLEEVMDNLMEAVKTLPPGKEALNKLKILRGNYEIKVSGYRNSLKILSDTTYKDRKHFLLELIQNADDATYTCVKPELTFIMHSNALELKYNEKGFSVDDVIAITDTGSSTKKFSKIDSNSFIGEKGIGFKSVFALASEVEIESGPWHFKLVSDTVIVPEVLESSKVEENYGTRMKIKFKEASSMNIIAKELYKFVEGSMESFLFLQKLSSFKLIDKRQAGKAKEYSIHIDPVNRAGNTISIKAIPSDKMRKYTIYTEELTFDKDLIWQRWENSNFNFKSIKRNITAAALLDSEKKEIIEGKVFCYLPTEITLPIPIFLQFDGHLTADRGRLHDPENNKWNKRIIDFLPDFLLNAILSWRKNEGICSKLPNYIPSEKGTDQLSGVIVSLKEKLKEASWILTNDKKKMWVLPDEAIIPDSYFISIFKSYPKFMAKAENALNMKFVNLKWAEEEKWITLMKIHYSVKTLTIDNALSIFSEVGMPSEVLKDSNEITRLYKYILESLSIKSNQYVKRILEPKLLASKIFPIRQNKRTSFTYLKLSQDEKVFYMSSDKKRSISTPGLSYKIVDLAYSYIPIIPKELDKEKLKELRIIRERNQALIDIIKLIGINELNSVSLLKEILIPSLKEENYDDSDDGYVSKLEILMYIFNSYIENIENRSYKNALAELYNCQFKNEEGEYCYLYEMLLPTEYRTEPLDYLYDGIKADVLAVPKDFKAKIVGNKKKFRDFLIHCGIRNRPGFYSTSRQYNDKWDFSNNDKERYQQFDKKIKSFTSGSKLQLSLIEFDDISIKLLNSSTADLRLLEKSIYQNWLENYKEIEICEKEEYFVSEPNMAPGYFNVSYKRFANRYAFVEDYMWAGVSRDRIPLKQINGDVVSSSKVKYSPKLKNTALLSVLQELPIVIVNDKDLGYDEKYLSSLKVEKIKLDDLVVLWTKLGDEQYLSILKLALELLNLGCEIGEFKIYDKKSEKIRNYTDFRIGDIASNNIPSITKQYGDTGEKLGKLLNLKEERAAKGYKDIFQVLFTDEGMVQQSAKENFLHVLRNWKKWSTYDKGYMAQKLKDRLKKLGINYKPVIINSEDEERSLMLTGILYLHLGVDNDEYYSLEKASLELGFSTIEDCGQLVLGELNYINKIEKREIRSYMQQYKASLSEKESAKFLGLFDFCGGFDKLHECILRAEYASRKLDDYNRLDINLPYLDKEQGRIIVSKEIGIKDIVINILSILEFAPLKSITRDIKELVYIPVTEKENKDIVVNDNIESDLDIYENKRDLIESVQQDIKDALRDNKSSSNYEIDREWKIGLMPEEEERIRINLTSKIQEAIDAGASSYVKRLAANKIVFDNKDSINPKEFLHIEYSGKCQVCGTELKLHNGTSYINVFHIKEGRGKYWWSNNPFNILGLCPNCHALAKHGGGRDFSNLYKVAKEINIGNVFPEEVEAFGGDYYVVDIIMNGDNKKLVMSKIHINYFSALFSKEESESEIALDMR
ncbi:sacsin N-terminal ATP-binding-like domain-containing protein [Clostridium folliculivorans]|uniref:sacsin N-terminal ATP-binding-like domain-containing protein n=1 Tax=Clostridium folliculivorans TaxID=2886038 RepID=UPI0021C48C68|nr:hypothetical protein [Clostridium folliculivorans]GKU30449.1 hypothetical protein CFB3_25560 [Clostridium folliculivorans]